MPNNWQEEAAQDLEFSDLSFQEIAIKYGRDRDTIIKLRKERGIVRRQATSRSGPRRAMDIKQLSPQHRALGVRITLYRGTRNYSELADELNVSRYVVKMMEIGAHDFTLSQLMKLSIIMGQSINELIELHRVPTNGR